jgi:hypothetical protein
MRLGGSGESSEQNVSDKATGQSTEQHLPAAKSVEKRGTVDSASIEKMGLMALMRSCFELDVIPACFIICGCCFGLALGHTNRND